MSLRPHIVCRILLPLICVFVVLTPTVRAQESSFECEEHNLFVDRLARIPSLPPLPDSRDTKILATQDFSGFAKYGFDSVTVIIRFDQDPVTATAQNPTGYVRVGAVIQASGQRSEQEIRARNEWKPELQSEYSELSMLLRARPSSPGSPAINVEQPEAGVPIFLVKFIGIAAAGGWGDVDSDNAMVLDLRRHTLSIPGALGCVKDDFAGQGPGGYATCHWDHARTDYDCDSSFGGFLLVSGKKTKGKTDPPFAERIRFRKGQSSADVGGSVAADQAKQYFFSVAKGDQHLSVRLDSPNKALKFAVVEVGVDPSIEMIIYNCIDEQNAAENCVRWQGNLPDPADYLIRVYGGAAKYTLKVGIQ